MNKCDLLNSGFLVILGHLPVVYVKSEDTVMPKTRTTKKDEAARMKAWRESLTPEKRKALSCQAVERQRKRRERIKV